MASGSIASGRSDRPATPLGSARPPCAAVSGVAQNAVVDDDTTLIPTTTLWSLISRQPMHDVIVVGGGPAGLYTALLLARDGFDVAVLEEHDRSGEPVHCTGVLADGGVQIDSSCRARRF